MFGHAKKRQTPKKQGNDLMSGKHAFYKYASGTLSFVFVFILITTMTSQKTDQPEAKPQLKKQMKQSALNQPKHRVYPTIVLPPPPPLPPEIGKQSTKSSSVSSSQQFMSAKKQVKRVIQDKPVKIHKVLKPTAEYISKYTHRNKLKKRQETAPAKLKDYQRIHTKTANFEKAKLLKIKDFSKGRVLLKKLEHGKGPQIEVSWPDKLSQKQKLYFTLTKCFGMKTAGLNSSNQLFQKKDAPNKPLKLNVDTSSGFIREVNGRVSNAEVDETVRIKQKHSNQIFKSFVRIFPRQVDASLLQGLHSVLGDDFSKAKQIKASYRLNEKDVEIFDISNGAKMFSAFFQLRKSSRQC